MDTKIDVETSVFPAAIGCGKTCFPVYFCIGGRKTDGEHRNGNLGSFQKPPTVFMAKKRPRILFRGPCFLALSLGKDFKFST